MRSLQALTVDTTDGAVGRGSGRVDAYAELGQLRRQSA